MLRATEVDLQLSDQGRLSLIPMALSMCFPLPRTPFTSLGHLANTYSYMKIQLQHHLFYKSFQTPGPVELVTPSHLPPAAVRSLATVPRVHRGSRVGFLHEDMSPCVFFISVSSEANREPCTGVSAVGRVAMIPGNPLFQTHFLGS